MKRMISICFAIVVFLLPVNAIGGHMEGFVDMEDFASFAADWQDPLQLEDLELFTTNWMTYYVAEPSLAWWKMEETEGSIAYDSTGNGYDLLPQSGFVIADATTEGKINNGMMFPGTGARLTQATLLEAMPESLTIAGWVKPDATNMSATQCWISKQNAASNGHIMWLRFNMIGGSPSTIRATISSDGTGDTRTLYSGSVWEDDTWYHYAFTWDFSGAKLYVNGELEDSNDEPIMNSGTQWDLSIASGGSTSSPFKGVIDDVRIYSSVLSAGDIQSLYNSASEFQTYALIVNSGSGSGNYLKNAVVDIAADVLPNGQEFDVWAGDTEYIADIHDPTTTVTVPDTAVNVTATYHAATLYTLTVNNGTGSGSYVENLVVNITADPPPAGQVFDVWTGDTAYIDDVYNPTITITMPATAVNVTATFKAAPLYTLTVSSGTGDGSYYEGFVVNIAANAASVGQIFDAWIGNVTYIDDIYDPTTSLTMPGTAITVTATYKPLYTLTVNIGTGDGNYYEGQVVNIASSSPPAGYVFNAWTGDIAYVLDVYDSTTTVTMPAAGITVTATYKDQSQANMLTVINGTGDGNYVENAVVDITADEATTGQEFDVWTGDTTYIDDVYNPTATVTMPAHNVAVTATYKTPPGSSDQTVLLETEGFDDHGGWVLDQQFMDQMGSPFLLAHGINSPIADATTTATFPSTGTYNVWVRTRDWTAIWKEPYLDSSSVKYADGAPGQFEVLVNGTALPTIFGVEGLQWHWQDGGTIFISDTNVTVTLHDLTGYEGRCDAIVFSKDYTSSPPPNMDPEMKSWRQDMLGNSGAPEFVGQYDLVVIGGGMAGTCAAVSAARLGVSVALIQDRPVLGGNNSSEVRVNLSGTTRYEPYTRIGDIVDDLDPYNSGNAAPGPNYKDEKKLAVVQAEPNIDLYLNYRGNEVVMDGDDIAAVIAESTVTGHRIQIEGSTFADCTGDAVIGYLAGADWAMTVTDEGLGTRMGKSNLWRFVNTGTSATFPSVPWALNLQSGSFPTGGLGGWFWESGFYYDSFDDAEYVRDWNFRAAYGTWDALKNKMSGYGTYLPEWQAYISGKRESRRLLGDIILNKDDLMNLVYFDDGCFPLTWSIDLHYPNGAYGVNKGFGRDEFISVYDPTNYPRPYWAPYRSLYSRNVSNLFMAGRNISVTHQALGAVRVMKTTGMMGEIVGMAASLCKKHNTTPRDVYINHLGELIDLMVGPMEGDHWTDFIGPSLLLGAEVTVSSNYSASYPKSYINDGVFNVTENILRWMSSSSSMPDYITFQLAEPVTISAARIVNGYYSGGNVGSTIKDFHFQYDNGQGWQDIPGAWATDNTESEWIVKFTHVKTDSVRLVVTETPSDISRIWEIELFHPKADFNDDGFVNFVDFSEMSRQWQKTESGLSSDLDGSDSVDLVDLEIFSYFWPW